METCTFVRFPTSHGSETSSKMQGNNWSFRPRKNSQPDPHPNSYQNIRFQPKCSSKVLFGRKQVLELVFFFLTVQILSPRRHCPEPASSTPVNSLELRVRGPVFGFPAGGKHGAPRLQGPVLSWQVQIQGPKGQAAAARPFNHRETQLRAECARQQGQGSKPGRQGPVLRIR